MLATKIGGWMCDFGESAPLNAKLYDSAMPTTFHNNYPYLWGELNKRAVQTAVDRQLITKEEVT